MESLKVNPNPASLGLPSNEEQKKREKKRRKKSSANCRVKGYYKMNEILKGEVKNTAQPHCRFIPGLHNESTMRGACMIYGNVM